MNADGSSETHNFDKFFTNAINKLGLSRDQGLVAKTFWNAFGSVALGSKDDYERNLKLLEDLNKLGASFSKINVKDIDGKNNVPFYTVKVLGEQLIKPEGSTTFNFDPYVYTPELFDKERTKYSTVQIGLPVLSQKIIEGAAEMHKHFSQSRGGFRRDLLQASETMNSHFVQAVLAVADMQIG